MRERDRNMNGLTNFPKLYYPELYLLHGGYKAFFEQYSVSLCYNGRWGMVSCHIEVED